MSFKETFDLLSMTSKSGILVGLVSIVFAFGWAFSHLKYTHEEDNNEYEFRTDLHECECDECDECESEECESEECEIQMNELNEMEEQVLPQLINKRNDLIKLQEEIDSIQTLLDNLKKEITTKIT
jgi:hypothetical protein